MKRLTTDSAAWIVASCYIVLISISISILGQKYINLKKAYKKAEQEKVWYCKEYNKLKYKQQ